MRKPIGLSVPYREFNEVEKQSKVKQTLIAEAKKREWVGLTDEEIENSWKDSCTIDNGKGANLTNQPFYHLVKLVEAKLKEKNT